MAANKGLRTRNWGDLDYDVFVKILMTLNFLDLISVSRVCSSWKEACCNPILWQKLDLTVLPFNFFNTAQKSCTWSKDQPSQRLTGILKTALRLSCGNLYCLVLHFSIFKNDELLIYAAERTPALKQLVLPAWIPMTVAGFEKAIKNWEWLESLAVASPGFPVKIMKLVGNYCKNLSKLKVMFPFDIDCAKAIIAYTPKLKVLSLQYTRVYREALLYILSNMQQLEVLNISHSTVVEPTEDPGYDELCEGIDDSIMKLASGLKQFLFCQTESCDVCKDSIVCNEDIFQWSRFKEKVWRVDEVNVEISSFADKWKMKFHKWKMKFLKWKMKFLK